MRLKLYLLRSFIISQAFTQPVFAVDCHFPDKLLLTVRIHNSVSRCTRFKCPFSVKETHQKNSESIQKYNKTTQYKQNNFCSDEKLKQVLTVVRNCSQSGRFSVSVTYNSTKNSSLQIVTRATAVLTGSPVKTTKRAPTHGLHKIPHKHF